MTTENPPGTKEAKHFWMWPVNTTTISGYGYTASHHALDIGARSGSKLFAPTDGVVYFAGWNNEGYGNLIIIKAYDGKLLYMAHLSQINVKKGMTVTTGETIGKTGSTGNSSGPHLHFEIRTSGGGGWINPYSIFGKSPVPGKEISPAPLPGSTGTGTTTGTGTKTGAGVDVKTGALTSDILGIGAWWETVKADWAANRAKYGIIALGGAVALIGIYGLVSGEAAHIVAGGKAQLGL